MEDQLWEEIVRRGIPIDFTKAALVVIDMQYLFASRDHGLFARLRAEGHAEGSEYALERIENSLTPNIARLAQSCRAVDVPVIYARCVSLRGDGSDQTIRHRTLGLVCTLDSLEAQMLKELEPQPGDIVLNKTGSSVFNSTNLEHILRNMGLNTIILTGIWTNSCVEGAARDAGDLDFGVVLVDDACAAVTPELHRAALAYLGNNFATVTTTDNVLKALEAGATSPA
jgi:nicotinamidase-related amidase